VRRALDTLYDAAAWAAAFFMVGVLLMVLASVLGRELGFNLRGSDSYAGYCMAAASFLALAHTLKRNEHIRVGLFLEHSGPRTARALQWISHAVGAFFCLALAFYSARLVWQSYTFNDISQGNDATPLWIPQLAMALGAAILAVAMVDELILEARGRKPAGAKDAADELKLIE
jgi:TRAP-type C4-dicarboxylate transport system permease small subunit